MTFAELGAALQAEREKKGLTIDAVANQLKISPRLLRALESGDGQAMPHPAYARGFIRSYASLLGFSNDEIQNLLSGLQPEDLKKPKPVKAVASEEPEPLPQPPKPKKNSSGAKVFVAFIILGLIAGGAWWAWQAGMFAFLPVKKERPTDLVENLPGADTYLARRPAPAQVEPERQKPVEAPAPPLQETPEPQAEQETSEPPAEAEVEVAQENAPDQHKLVIVATEECWIHSNADKTDMRQFSLRKGDTFALTFAKSLELKLGNAGGVRLRYDGNDLPAPGTSGQVRTLTFPPKSD